MTMMKFLFNPQTCVRYALSNGTFFEIDNFKDELLRNGMFGSASPVKQGQLLNTLEELLKTTFEGNVKRMSEVLSEIYGKSEYTRQGLYKTLPSLKEIKHSQARQRRLLRQWNKYFSDQVARDFARKEICKAEGIREPSEELGLSDSQNSKVKKKLRIKS